MKDLAQYIDECTGGTGGAGGVTPNAPAATPATVPGMGNPSLPTGGEDGSEPVPTAKVKRKKKYVSKDDK